MYDFSVEAVNNERKKNEHQRNQKKTFAHWVNCGHLRVTNYIVNVLNEQL